MKIDKIFNKYYFAPANKYVVYARVKVDGVYRFERLFFATEEEAQSLEEGDVIKEDKP